MTNPKTPFDTEDLEKGLKSSNKREYTEAIGRCEERLRLKKEVEKSFERLKIRLKDPKLNNWSSDGIVDEEKKRLGLSDTK